MGQLFEKMTALTGDQEEQLQRNEMLQAESLRLEQDVLAREKDINRRKEAETRLKRMWDNEKKKVARLENKRAEEKMERSMLQEQIVHLNKDILQFKKETETRQKKINEMHR